MYTSELSTEWPLDIVRRLTSEAEELDLTAHERVLENGGADEIIDSLVTLDSQNPLIGQDVIISGQAVSPSKYKIGDFYPPSLNGVESVACVRGIYRGLALRLVFDAEQIRFMNRIMHCIDTSAKLSALKTEGHENPKEQYVSVIDSEIVSILPLNAHSAEDLKGDDVIAKFEDIISNATSSHLDKIKRAAYVIRRLFLQNHIYGDELTKQRISYLNSRGLLDDVTVFSSDVITCRRPFSPDNILRGSVNSLNSIRALKPNMFELAPIYIRMPARVKQVTTEAELYVVTRSADTERVQITPIRSIDRIRVDNG